MIQLVGQVLDTYSVVSNEKFDSQIGLKKLDIIRKKVLRKFGWLLAQWAYHRVSCLYGSMIDHALEEAI